MFLLTTSKNTFLVLLLTFMACGRSQEIESLSGLSQSEPRNKTLVVAANRTEIYFELLRDKNFALVANQTSVIFTREPHNTNGSQTQGFLRDSIQNTGAQPGAPSSTDQPAVGASGEAHQADGLLAAGGEPWVHLADSLLGAGLSLKKIFAPEHGFRGQVDAGEKVTDGVDPRTGLAVLSLHGSNRKPTQQQLEGLDLVLFDIQDVGVRFYTYIATLQLVMEACAESGIPVIVLDRPNPNIHYVDGPMMEKEHRSFLGKTEIPLVYGMTIGEYARMINEEGWLQDGLRADLTVIPLEGYSRNTDYVLPIPPSPNLPNNQAVRLYPSLGLLEGTHVNAGRGTSLQFQSFGAPFLSESHFPYAYTPESRLGALNPKHLGKRCYGMDLSEVSPPQAVDLKWLIEAYTHRVSAVDFFITEGFTKHAGTAELQNQIEAGMSADQIREKWQDQLEIFKKIREKYLLYD